MANLFDDIMPESNLFDDVAPGAVNEGAWDKVKHFGRDVVAPTPSRAIAGVQQGIGGMNQWIGETLIPNALGGQALADAGKEWVAEGKAVNEQISREHPVDPNSWSGAAVGALDSIAQQAVPLAVGVMTANPAIPLGAMGMSTAGRKYGEKRSEGFDIFKSGTAAAGHGIVEVATEKFATEKLFDLVKAPVASTLAKMFGAEFVGENVATITQDMIDKGYAKPGMTNAKVKASVKDYFTSGEAWQAVKNTTKSTVIQTALMGGAAKGANKLLEMGTAPRAIEADHDLLNPKGTEERNEVAQALRTTRNQTIPDSSEAAEVTDGSGETGGLVLPVGEGEELGGTVPDSAAGALPPGTGGEQGIGLPVEAAQVEEVGAAEAIEAEAPAEVTPQPPLTPLDEKAHEAATSPLNDLPQPTDAQIQAGNYKKAHLSVQGLDISIENPAGSVRSGINENGKPWETTLANHYGYLKGVRGADKDHLDIFVAPGAEEAGTVYIVDQKNIKTGKFDESKVIIGPATKQEAQQAYLANYDKSGKKRIQAITEMPLDRFKFWIAQGNTSKAFAPQSERVRQAHNREALKTGKTQQREAEEAARAIPTEDLDHLRVAHQNVRDTDFGKIVLDGNQAEATWSTFGKLAPYLRDAGVKNKETALQVIQTALDEGKLPPAKNKAERRLVEMAIAHEREVGNEFLNRLNDEGHEAYDDLIDDVMAYQLDDVGQEALDEAMAFFDSMGVNDEGVGEENSQEAGEAAPRGEGERLEGAEEGGGTEGTKIYRGVTDINKQSEPGIFSKGVESGNFWTKNVEVAKFYGGEKGTVLEAMLPATAKVLDLETPEGQKVYEKLTGWAFDPYRVVEHGIDESAGDITLAEALRKEGYDAVHSFDMDGPETLILNKDILQAKPQKPLMDGDQSKLFATPPAFGKKPQGAGTVAENPMLTEMKEREAESKQGAMFSLKQTESPEFKKWFGESKVVDADGKPLVVYHSTTGDFDTFKRKRSDIGMHFGTIEQAEDRGEFIREIGAPRSTNPENIMPVYLSINKPLRLDDLGAWNRENIYFALREMSQFQVYTTDTLTELREKIRDEGYDGIVYKNTGEVGGNKPYREKAREARKEVEKVFGKGKNSFSIEDQKDPSYKAWRNAENKARQHREESGEDSYIIFDPTQVKSATGNNGEFDPNNPDIRFTAKGQTSGLINAIVRKELAPLVNRLKDAYSVEILQSERDLPKNLLAQIKSENVEGRVEGVFDPETNRVFLVADNIKDLTRAEEVLKHELVHKGIGKVFGNRLNAHLDLIKAERGLSSRRAAEEFIAEKGEQYAGQGAIKRFIAAARQLLRDMGFRVKFSDADILSIAGKSIEATEKGAVGIHSAGARFAAAWHGSPHDFDKFQSHAIGTGEGAQSYGHGLYFAGSKGVAEWYKDKLSKYKLLDSDGMDVPYPDTTAKRAAYVTLRDFGGDFVKTKENLARAKWRGQEFTEEAMQWLDSIESSGGVSVENKGKLYHVELAPQEDEYLLWDKPLSEQSEKVKVLLEKKFDSDYGPLGRLNSTGKKISNGQAIYHLIQNYYTGESANAQRAASDYLHSLGIRGIKYLDGTSRNRPIRDIKKAFLDALSEDAEFDDVTDMIGTGTFSPEQESLLRALEKDDWLGFDYPAQAISAALGNNLSGYDASKELKDAVAELAKDQTFNYVIFHEDDVSITAKFSLKDKAQSVKEAIGEKTMEEHAHNVLDRVRGILDNPGGLGTLGNWKEYLARRYRTLGALSHVKDFAHDLAATFNKASTQDREAIFHYLTDKNGDPSTISTAFRQEAVKAKQMIEDIGDKLVFYGLLSQEVVDANRGEYLPTVYLKHLIGKENFAALGSAKKLDLTYTKKKFLKESLRSQGLSEEEIDLFMKTQMGQIKDPGYLLAKAYSIPSRDMAILDWLSEIAKHSEWVLPKSLVDWSSNVDAAKRHGRIEYRKNPDGSHDLKIEKVKSVETKHSTNGAGLGKLLGSDKLADFIKAGNGKQVLRKDEVNGKPVYKPTPWKRVGHVQYKLNQDGTYGVKIKERVKKIDEIKGVTDLKGLVGEKKAAAIENDEGRIVGGRKVTPFWLTAEADRIQKMKPLLPEADREEAQRVADRMRETAEKALGGIPTGALPNDYRQMPNSPKYGPLRGMIVRKEIYNDIVGNINIAIGERSLPEKILGTGGAVSKLTGMWKWSKVAANPPAQVRNLISNMVLLNLSGIPFYRVPIRMAQAIKEIRGNGKHWQVAKKNGVKEATFSNTEMARIEADLIDSEARNAGVLSWAQVKSLFAKIVNTTGDVYQFMEAVGKTAKIIDEMEKGRTAQEAAMEAHKWLFDYSLVSPGVKYMRNAPIGIPFITFMTKVLPRLTEVAVTKPWRFTPYVALAYGLQSMVAGMLGVDDDDLDKLKEALPNWIREKQHVYLLPYKDDAGRWQAVDLGYFFPWTQWTELGENIIEGDAKGAMRQSGVLGGPLPDLVAAIKTNLDPFTQRPIVDKYADPPEQAGQIFGYLYQMAMPPWLTQRGTAGKVYSALSEEVDKNGLPKSTGKQAALSTVGVNLYAYDPALTREQNLKRMEYEIGEVQRQAKSALQDKNLSAGEREKIRQKFLGRVQKMNMERIKYAAGSMPKDQSLMERN